MNWKDYNVSHLVSALVLTAALLFCGQALWQNYAVAKPLDKALQGISGVETVSWHKKNEMVTIEVTLKNAVNFFTTYTQITEAAKQLFDQKQIQIKISDHRTPELEELYYDVHYYLQEAIVTGSFALMNERIQQKAAEHNAIANIYVTTDTIYLRLAKGTDELYMLIARPSHLQEAKNNAQ